MGRRAAAVLFSLTLVFLLCTTALALEDRKPVQAAPATSFHPQVLHPARSAVTPPLRDMPRAAPEAFDAAIKALPLHRLSEKAAAQPVASDPLLQGSFGQSALSILPINNFAGTSNISGVLPPDPNGAIGFDPATGRKYYVQWVNLVYAVWDVTSMPTLLAGFPKAGNSIFAALGSSSVCATTNRGDPLALFDHLARRWVLTQFAYGSGPPYAQCLAVSTSGDPAGTYTVFEYDWPNGYFNDYPKLGIWPDAYYMTANQFSSADSTAMYQGVGVVAFDRAALLAGNSNPTAVYFDLYGVNANFAGMLPADLDGPPPPPGAPGLFAEVDDASLLAPSDAIRLWQFHVDWGSPGNSTFGLSGQPNQILPVASFSLLPCVGSFSTSCIPQPDTPVKLDAVGDRLMFRLAYRNFGDHQSLVLNHTVLADSADRAGVRWYELRSSGSDWSIYQQGTYAPADGLYRWMGSLAMDRAGDIALGYSLSGPSAPSYPSVAYTGRAASDQAGAMTQPEVILVAGGGSQTHTPGRWGDYSSMSVDPQDDCTFWYTQEYMPATSDANWATRIGSFRFPNCSPQPSGPLTVSPNVVMLNLLPGQSAQRTLTIQNGDGIPVGFTVSESNLAGYSTGVDFPWVSVTPTYGPLSSGGSQQVILSFTSQGISVGIYTGYLWIADTPPYGGLPVRLGLMVGLPVFLPLISR
jgi:hypothetical protein